MELVFGWVVTEAELRQSELLLRAASSVAIFAGGVFITIVACALYDLWRERQQAKRAKESLGEVLKRSPYVGAGYHPRGICSCGGYECEQRARDAQPMSEDVAEALIYVPKPRNVRGD